MSHPAGETIYALSSGSAPAAIAVVRISGPDADPALMRLAGRLPEPRRASLTELRAPQGGELLDRAIVLRFPGPKSATGEDLVELHLHGGRSVIAALLAALASIEGLRQAQPGEFTRRAFENGRLDLAEAEGLGDLLLAETQSQRRAALALAGGALSRKVEAWQETLLSLSAQVEAALDFGDEADVEDELPAKWGSNLHQLLEELSLLLERPPVERLREGVKVVIAGPPNSGKSSLINALVGRDAAIVSAVAGTTRDLVEAPVSLAGTPLLLVDTAGLRDTQDEVEGIGVARARASVQDADLILWLGAAEDAPEEDRTILLQSKCDLAGAGREARADLHISSRTGEGLDRLIEMILERSKRLLPQEGEVAINARHQGAIREAQEQIHAAGVSGDMLIVAEALRGARGALDRVTGRAGVENMLDALFGRFCIGK